MDQELITHLQRIEQRFDEQDRRLEERDQRIEQRFDEQDRRFDEFREETRNAHRETRVMVEGLRSEIHAVADGVATVNEKVDRVQATLERDLEEHKALTAAGFRELRRVDEELRHKDEELDQRVTRLEAAQASG